MWTDRSASDGGESEPYFPYRGVELSPDGKRIAVHRHEGNGGDIWVMEPPPTAEAHHVRRDAGQLVAHLVASRGQDRVRVESQWQVGLVSDASDGSGVEELLFESELPKAPMSWSPGRQAAGLLGAGSEDGRRHLGAADGRREEAGAADRDAQERDAPPDLVGRQVDRLHVRSHRPEGSLRATVPVRQRTCQVSPESGPGGDWPRWKRDGKELYYHSLDNVQSAGIYTAGGHSSGRSSARRSRSTGRVRVRHAHGSRAPHGDSCEPSRRITTPSTCRPTASASSRCSAC